ncbi:MAG: hypothetical protein ACW98F_13150 [Candidatus Hodarchaeales archaeon]|jgi:hypothetical protein
MNLSTIEKSMLIATGLLFAFTFICGMWIQFSGEEIALGDVLFHIGLAVLTTVSTAVSMFFLINKKIR